MIIIAASIPTLRPLFVSVFGKTVNESYEIGKYGSKRRNYRVQHSDNHFDFVPYGGKAGEEIYYGKSDFSHEESQVSHHQQEDGLSEDDHRPLNASEIQKRTDFVISFPEPAVEASQRGSHPPGEDMVLPLHSPPSPRNRT